MTAALYVAAMATEFGDWLDERIPEVGISQAQLSAASGVAESQLSRYRRGQTIPDPATLKKLAPHLDASFEQMMIIAGHTEGDEKGAAKTYIVATDNPKIHRLIRRAKDTAEVARPDELALIEDLLRGIEQRRR